MASRLFILVYNYLTNKMEAYEINYRHKNEKKFKEVA
jgi:uncharacterized sporulation protein YeaH/YhbH (DUF444 family)